MKKAYEDLATRLDAAKLISFDTETTSTDQMRADLVGISVAVDGDEGWYIPVGHQADLGQQLPVKKVMDALRGPFTDPKIQKVGHNINYDFIMLARNGVRPAPCSHSTA